ncbi:MAG: ribonuclease R [Proteobacteria bacterium]|nr:ribonuclease R [Pseudomonadota bacterium]
MHDPDAEQEKKRYERPIASRRLILETMESIGEPASIKRLAKTLDMEESWQRDALQNRLRAMVRDGQLIADRRNVYAIASRMDLVRGRIAGHMDGYGFLIPEADDEEDIFLGHRQMRGVFHGDIALVRIRGIDRRGRPEGEIVEVIERKTQQIVGRLYFENQAWFLESLNNRICQEILVHPADDLEEGLIVTAAIVDQPSMHGIPSCEVLEVLGEQLTAELEIKVSLHNHEIPYQFGGDVLGEVAALPAEVAPADKKARRDLRELPFVTIDGTDARDFDDAVYCEDRARGGWRLYVAIADVAHYVRLGTALDQEARLRGTSVYFPQHVVPMLPESLSNGLCSLRPDVDRLALVCEMGLSASGRVTSYQFYEAVIRSAARLTYEQVADGPPEGPFAPSLEAAYRLLGVLLSARGERGALDFDSTELAFEFDEWGAIGAISRRDRNRAHQLIEECMLCANVSAAAFIEKLELKGLFRVHQRPEEEKVEYLRTFLDSVGIGLPKGVLKPDDFQRALLELRSKPNGHVLQIVVLRSLSQAVYQPDNVGHFGLNYRRYTHFTSPIRRYPDLLTHRLIKSVIHGETTSALVRRFSGAAPVRDYDYGMDELVELGESCSFTERRAESAVYEVLEWMKCEYVHGRVGDTEPGVITGVTSFGFFVQLSEVLTEGLVHVSTLVNDYYQFDQASQCLVGEKSGLIFGLGDNVTVQIARVSVDERKIDFELVSHEPIKRDRPRLAKASRAGKPGKAGDRRGGKRRKGARR